MYAIIETGGKQYWVTPGETVRVDRLDSPQGQEMTFQALWAKGDDKSSPASRLATVVAEICSHLRGPKILVFKKRTKKAYKKMRGHRQDLTALRIKSISFN